MKSAPSKQKPERKKKQREPKKKAAPKPKQAAPKKGGATPKLTAQDLPRVIEALRASGGMKTGAAAMLKVSRRTLYTFLDEHPEIQEAAKEIGEELLDLAENQVAAAIRAGEMPTVRWFLELKGKERGYIRRVETTGKDGGPVETRQAPDLSGYSEQELAQLIEIEESRQKREAGATRGR